MADRTLQAETDGGLVYTETAGTYESKIDATNTEEAVEDVGSTDHILVFADGSIKKLKKADFRAEGVKDSAGDNIVSVNTSSVTIWVGGIKIASFSTSNLTVEGNKDLNVTGSVYVDNTKRISSAGAGTFASLEEGGEPMCRWRGKSDFDFSPITNPEDGDVAFDTTENKIRVYNSADTTWYPTPTP